MNLGEADQYGHIGKLVNFEVGRLTCRIESHIETHDGQLTDVVALARRSESRIVALSEQLSSSRADLEATSARFNELAGEIPADVAGLSAQLSRILNAASVEAEQIRDEAHRLADTVLIEAEERAARMLADAQAEFDSVTALRADLETQRYQVRVDGSRLREQAALIAADLVREAKDTAEEMLARAHRDIDAQRATAQAKLDELIQVRSEIATQLSHFYDKFQQFDDSADATEPVEAVRLVSDSAKARAARGAHAAPEVDPTYGALRDIG